MMIAKEYIDRIDKLNLFYLFFMSRGISQWLNINAPSVPTSNYETRLGSSILPIAVNNRVLAACASHIGGFNVNKTEIGTTEVGLNIVSNNLYVGMRVRTANTTTDSWGSYNIIIGY